MKERLAYLILLVAATLLLPAVCFSEEPVNINSDTLEYEGTTFTYTAGGQVKIQKGQVMIEADEVKYNEKSSEVFSEGWMRYEDPFVIIKAKRSSLNLAAKTGKLYEAEIFSKKDNYHVTGMEVEKKAENRYLIKEASFTTCDAPIPEWCFKGKDVDTMFGEKLKAEAVTFNIKDMPVLYSPYLRVPLGHERSTGLIMPDFSYIKSRGIHLGLPFFWAISENRDATFLLDLYGRRGWGQGAEYRYIEQDGSRGNLWAYHLKDKKYERDFWDLHGFHDSGDRSATVSGFLNLNYINSRDFYKEYNPYVITKSIDASSYLNSTTGRFLESTAEVSIKLETSRLYLRSQYLVDLLEGADDSAIPQRLPEVGYFINPQRLGPLVFSLDSRISNFWRKGNAPGQRLDIYPRLTHSYGSDIIIKQSLGLRETAYALSKTAGEYATAPHRESFDYSITANARLIKRYDSFVHIIEPTVGYTFIPASNSELPLFDSTELYSKTSKLELSIQNRFIDNNGEFLTFRISQALDAYRDGSSLAPLKLDFAVKRPVSIRAEVSIDPATGRFEGLNSDIGVSLKKISFSVGERFNKSENILFYTLGVNYTHSKTLSAEGTFWYDARSGGLNDFIAKLKYQKQCWGAALVVTKMQKDYSVSVLFNLLGLGTVKI